MNLLTRIRRALSPKWAARQDALALVNAIDDAASKIWARGKNIPDYKLHINPTTYTKLRGALNFTTATNMPPAKSTLVTSFGEITIVPDDSVETWELRPT